MQIETTIRYHYAPTKMAEVKGLHVQNEGEYLEELELLHTTERSLNN